MATEKNITMKQFNGTDYDTLYPKTIASQITDVYSQTEILTTETLTKYGLTADKLPNDVFQQIKVLIDNAQSNANSRAKIQTGSYVGTGTYGASNPCSLTFDFVPKYFWLYGHKDSTTASEITTIQLFTPYNPANTESMTGTMDNYKSFVYIPNLPSSYSSYTASYDYSSTPSFSYDCDGIGHYGMINSVHYVFSRTKFSGTTLQWFSQKYYRNKDTKKLVSQNASEQQFNTSGTTYYWLIIG